MTFCFPEKAQTGHHEEIHHHQHLQSNQSYSSKRDKKKDKHKKPKVSVTSSNFYVESPLTTDDVEEMKARAQQNKLFVYIKIPEVPICVSYKGEREKNKIVDVANFLLHLPTIEYHNVTFTWHDLLLSVKTQIKDSLISQAIKQKLSMRHSPLLSSGSRMSRAGSIASLDLSMSSASSSVGSVGGSVHGASGSGKGTSKDHLLANFHADDERKAELLLGLHKLMPKRGGVGKKDAM